MTDRNVLQLPTVVNSQLSDIIYAVHNGSDTQQTIGQIAELIQAGIVISYPGNPNGNVPGTAYQLLYDTSDEYLWICTSTGGALTAVWTLIAANLLPVSNGGTGRAILTANTILIGNGTGVVSLLGPLTDGQLLIGNTGNPPTVGLLSAGANISISNGPGTINIAAIGSASFGFTNVTGTSQAMTPDSGYVTNNAGLVTLTLPLTAAFGTEITVMGQGAGGWLIAQNASQQVNVGNVGSTVGVTGSIQSTHFSDSIRLICTVANTTWRNLCGPQGIIQLN